MATPDEILNIRALALEEQRKAAILVQSADLLEIGYQSDKILLNAKDARIAELEKQLANTSAVEPITP